MPTKMRSGAPARRFPHTLTRCEVCGKPCQYHYYSARTCEGCKQFFYRVLNEQKFWTCDDDKKCSIKPVANKCKGCRLDRCLQAGMDWRNVGAEKGQHVARLELRKLKLMIIVAAQSENKELEFLLRVVDAQCRIMHAFSEFKEEWSAKFGSISEAVASPENILGLWGLFSTTPRRFTPQEMDAIREETAESGICHPHIYKCILVDRLICVGLVKLMPAFGKLSIGDKTLIARHMAMPFLMFANAYCSQQLNSGTWIRKDGGYPFLTSCMSEKCQRDKRLMVLADKFFTKSVEPFTRTSISKAEYAFMLAILLSQNAAVPDLSADARQILYTESTRYSALLLRHLQCRLGSPEAGAKKFAECLLIIEQYFQQIHIGQLWFSYSLTFFSSAAAAEGKNASSSPSADVSQFS